MQDTKIWDRGWSLFGIHGYSGYRWSKRHEKYRTSLSRVRCEWYWEDHVVRLPCLGYDRIELCVPLCSCPILFSLACAILLQLHPHFHTHPSFFCWQRTFFFLLQKERDTHIITAHGQWAGRVVGCTHKHGACYRKCDLSLSPLSLSYGHVHIHKQIHTDAYHSFPAGMSLAVS